MEHTTFPLPTPAAAQAVLDAFAADAAAEEAISAADYARTRAVSFEAARLVNEAVMQAWESAGAPATFGEWRRDMTPQRWQEAAKAA